MNMDMLAVCGAVAGILSVFAYLPYIIDTLRGATQPARSTWMIWAVLSSILCLSLFAEGATDSLWFAAVQAGGTVIVFLLSIRYGVGNFMSWADFLVILLSAFGLMLWYVTDSAVYALSISIGISTLGGSLTVIKACRCPGSETLSAWLLSFVAAVFAMISVGEVDVVMLAYPVYLFLLYGSILVAMRAGRVRPVQQSGRPTLTQEQRKILTGESGVL